VYLGFSRLPAARSAIDAHAITTVRWSDMRFAGGMPGLDERGSRAIPFTATVRIGTEGQVLEERLGR
jgi:hypothetical protein